MIGEMCVLGKPFFQASRIMNISRKTSQEASGVVKMRYDDRINFSGSGDEKKNNRFRAIFDGIIVTSDLHLEDTEQCFKIKYYM